jgi:hypothetical protein
VLARWRRHGVLRRKGAATRLQEPPAHRGLLPARPPRHSRPDDARALGRGLRAGRGRTHHVRLRSHARMLARAPVYGLDGRRGLALEARLRVSPLQLRGRHPVDARACRAQVPRRGRSPRQATDLQSALDALSERFADDEG